MTTYNTGNPIGSKDPRDLYDNAENLDTAVNDINSDTWTDRLGRSRKTMSGMEREFDVGQALREHRFNTFLESSGYRFLGDYAAGIEITEYNQIVRDSNGEFWRPSGQVELPYTTTGDWGGEEGMFVAVGDAALRQELANPDMGAAMVAFGQDNVSNALRSRVVQVASIADLRSLEPAFDGQQCELLGHTVAGIGGGTFYADFGSVAADDNGVTVVTTGGKRWVRRLEGFITPQMFGVIGDGVADDTDVFQEIINAVSCTVAGHNEGGALAGMPLIIPVGEYQCGSLVIDAPVHIKGQANGQATDLSERAKIRFTGTGTLFDLTNKAGYCLIEGISLEGAKVGGVDIDAAVYGNVAVKVGYGIGGTFRDVYVEGFDIGLLATTRPGDDWGGAYRYFEHCKFRNNTFSVVLDDFVTDTQFSFCDFRSNLTDKEGYILIKTGLTGGAYQTAGFVQCMFENLGGSDFNKRGLQITGESYVKAIACYFEQAAVYVGPGAHFVSNSYHRIQSGSARIGGGGHVDLSGISAHVKKINLPRLSDSFWTADNLTAETPALLDGRYCNIYTVEEGESNQLTTNDFTSLHELSTDVVPASFEFMLALVELEYYAPAGVTINLTVTATAVGNNTARPSVGTWTEPNYYDGVPGWKRKVYALPLPSTISGFPVDYLRPHIDVVGASQGTKIGIRSVSLSVVAV